MTHSYSCKGSSGIVLRLRHSDARGLDEVPVLSVPAGEIERFVVKQIQSIGTDEDMLNRTIGQIESRSEQLRDNLESYNQIPSPHLRHTDALDQ